MNGTTVDTGLFSSTRLPDGHLVFDRYNIVNEQELLTAGERLAAYIAGNQE